MCKRPAGCFVEVEENGKLVRENVEEIVSDPEVNDWLYKFMRAKALYEANEISSLLEKAYTELDLMDSPDFLMSLETTWGIGRAKARDKINAKSGTGKRNR